MRPPRAVAALLAGLFLFDILVNLPGFTHSAPFASLLLPSIDLLVIAAACMGIAQAGERSRLPLRIAVSVLVVILAACSAGVRFGFDVETRLFAGGGVPRIAAGVAVSLLVLAAAGVAAFVLAGMVARGLGAPISRNIVLLAISLAAVLQVVTGRRLFSPSVIPRLFALIGSQAR